MLLCLESYMKLLFTHGVLFSLEVWTYKIIQLYNVLQERIHTFIYTFYNLRTDTPSCV